MPAAAWILFGSAAVIAATAFARLVWVKGFQSMHVKAGPVQMDLEAVQKLREVHAELKPNGGLSLRDAVDRIERRVTALEEYVTQPPEEP